MNIAIAIAIAATLGGVAGAGATSIAFSYSAAPSATCPSAADRPLLRYVPVPTTGSKGF